MKLSEKKNNIWNQIWKKNNYKFNDFPTMNVQTFEEYHLPKKNKKKYKILDVGCGNGRNLIYLKKKGFDVYGIDKSSHCISDLRKKFKKETNKFKVSLISAIDFPDLSFDAVICDGSLYYCKLNEFRKGILEMKRVLKKNGLIRIYTISNKHKNSRNRNKTIETKIQNGWEKNLLITLLSHKDIKVFFKGFKKFKIGLDQFNFINKDKLNAFWVITANKI